MKTTIKKLERMGLSEEVIKYVLGIRKSEYKKLKKNSYQLYIPNLTDIIKKYDKKGIVNLDEQKAEIYDSIYNINNLSSDKTLEEKVNIINNFPKLEKILEEEVKKQRIEALKNKHAELLKQIEEIQNEIADLNTVTPDYYDTTSINDIEPKIKNSSIEIGLPVLEDGITCGLSNSIYTKKSTSITVRIRKNYMEIYNKTKIGDLIIFKFKNGDMIKTEVTKKGHYNTKGHINDYMLYLDNLSI